MKLKKILIAIVAFVIIGTVACKKDDPVTNTSSSNTNPTPNPTNPNPTNPNPTNPNPTNPNPTNPNPAPNSNPLKNTIWVGSGGMMGSRQRVIIQFGNDNNVTLFDGGFNVSEEHIYTGTCTMITKTTFHITIVNPTKTNPAEKYTFEVNLSSESFMNGGFPFGNVGSFILEKSDPNDPSPNPLVTTDPLKNSTWVGWGQGGSINHKVIIQVGDNKNVILYDGGFNVSEEHIYTGTYTFGTIFSVITIYNPTKTNPTEKYIIRPIMTNEKMIGQFPFGTVGNFILTKQ